MLNKNIKTLTQKQRIIFDFIAGYLEKNETSPTVVELSEFMGVSSLRTITQYLESLEKKGLISRARHQKRGIRILKQNPFSETVTLPVLSSAGCDNMSVFAEQLFDEFVTIDRDFLAGRDPEKVVAFNAVGNSMVDAGISTGDLVLVEKTTDICEKDKVAAVVDGMAVIKQISFADNAVILKPMSKDPQYRPIVMKKNFQVFGKVIEVIKGFGAGDELVYESL